MFKAILKSVIRIVRINIAQENSGISRKIKVIIDYPYLKIFFKKALE